MSVGERRFARGLVVLERVIVAALASVLILVVGSVLVTGRMVAPSIAATYAVNEFEDHLFQSHLAFKQAQSDGSVMEPLGAAERVCAKELLDVALPESVAQSHAHPSHPCASLPVLIAAASTALGSAEHAEYDAAFEEVIADGEALDATVADTLTDAQWWARVVQLVTACLLAALVVLIVAAAGAHRRTTRRLSTALRREATHDALTGVFNRLELRSVLGRMAAESRVVGVLFLDLDGFKTVNDTNGHADGDALLVAVAERLCRLTGPGDTVVRLGGDEFGVVCADADEATALAVGERVVAGLRRPFLINGGAVTISASVGVTSDQAESSDIAELKRQADIAMYVAKAHGGDRAEVYRPQMHTEIVERIQLGEDLAAAVGDGQIGVAYQPIVDIASGRVRRVEALARWMHPTRGVVAPDVFIGLAEERGLIDALGAQVLWRACHDLRAWHQLYPAAADVGVAVNVATRQLLADDFHDVVCAALASSGLAAEFLTVEVTEGALAAGHAQAEAILAELRALDVRVAIDDFGTGHSSLSRLRDLRVHELKIDRAFISPIGQDPTAAPLVVSILDLAHSLALEVVAEGVETAAQLAFLAEHGCDLAQGYLFSRPRTAEDCAQLWSDGNGAHEVAVPVIHPLAAGCGHDDVTTFPGTSDVPGGSTTAALRTLLAKLTTMVGLDTVYLTRIDWEREIQHIELAHHTGETLVAEGLQVPWRETLCRLMLTTGPAATDDVPAAFPGNRAAVDLGLQTYVGVPLVDAGGKLYGTLCAASRERHPVTDDTLQLMEVFAALLGNRLTGPVPAQGDAAQRMPATGLAPTASGRQGSLVRTVDPPMRS